MEGTEVERETRFHFAATARTRMHRPPPAGTHTDNQTPPTLLFPTRITHTEIRRDRKKWEKGRVGRKTTPQPMYPTHPLINTTY